MPTSRLYRRFASLALCVLAAVACSSPQPESAAPTPPPSQVRHVEWSRNAVIYEVNIRQYSEEGTFKSVQARLPELRDLGVDILWLMPIHPIGELNRKGSQGSYYSVRDYKGVNPEFGTEQDFRDFVEAAHALGMKVILDWVANHTSWDHAWASEHPEWFTTDADGNFVPPVADWADVIDLNYDSPEMREAMIDALEYWVREFDVDGYRCDVAEMVPTDFWDAARSRLDAIKPVFMLAEAEKPEHMTNAFDMYYGWKMHHVFNRVASGAAVTVIDSLLEAQRSEFPADAYRMNFTSNHDENSWNGTEFERMGEGAAAFAVLSGTMEGMPLIYSGQEAGMDKRLEFFEKDPIMWGESPFRALYTTLNTLKHQNTALHNGTAGGPMVSLSDENEPRVYAFHRVKGNDKVLVVLNLSGEAADVSLNTSSIQDTFTDVFTGGSFPVSDALNIHLEPWGYRVYAKTGN